MVRRFPTAFPSRLRVTAMQADLTSLRPSATAAQVPAWVAIGMIRRTVRLLAIRNLPYLPFLQSQARRTCVRHCGLHTLQPPDPFLSRFVPPLRFPLAGVQAPY